MAYLEPSLDWESRVDSFVDSTVAPLTADEELQMIDVAIGLNGTCPSCDGTGYERVDVDEVGPCTDVRCTVRDNKPRVSNLARQYAADPRFAHLNRDAAWWQAVLDQDERARSKGARG